MLGFGLLGLGLSTVLALGVWIEVTNYLLAERQETAVHEVSVDSAALVANLGADGTSVPDLLDRLPAGDHAASLLAYQGRWYATSLSGGADSLPPQLREMVEGGTPAEQRMMMDGEPYLTVGLPLPHGQGSYFELFPLDDLDRTFSVLSIGLVTAAVVTSLLGLAVGRFAGRRVLRPLAEVGAAADEIAHGNLSARVHAEHDPDLGTLARSFNETVDALQQRVLADVRFAGDVSHELRTPLTSMLNAVQLLQNRRAELPEGAREPLDMLTVDVERFRRLVLDLLEISRAEEPPRRPPGEPVRLTELVRQAADTAAGRSVTGCAAGADELVLSADKRRLQQVVTNLVHNAEGHGGGCTRVWVEPVTGGARILVDDQGPGVPGPMRGRIFERFARDGDGSGVGLGLAIVDRHVRWHGGTVSVEERPGGGARFVVQLPTERSG